MDMLRSSGFKLISHYTYAAQASPVSSEESIERYCIGGYHPVHVGEIFRNRYQIISKLGYGVYSTVWLVRDLSSAPPQHVALKILTADSYGGPKPIFELDILEHIRRTDISHPGYQRAVHILDSFVHQGQNGNHLCLVLDLMGQSVLQLRDRFPNKQLPARIGRQIASQVLQALDWLHHSCGVIHADLKPDNILIEISDVDVAIQNHLVELDQHGTKQPADRILTSCPITHEAVSASSNLKIRITDFGVASWNEKHLTECIQPPSLRAPEVFLGAPWDYSVDIWGFACVIYELVQGRVLFRGRPGPNDAWTAEEDQLAQLIELFGPVPESMRRMGRLSEKYFDGNGELLHIAQLYPCSLRALLAQTLNKSMSVSDYDKFNAFLGNMLQYEPHKRGRPRDLLQSLWLLESDEGVDMMGSNV